VGQFGYCQSPSASDASCYPLGINGDCPAMTVLCPDVSPLNTVASCVACVYGSGPCQHAIDKTCHPFGVFSGVCAPGLIYCGDGSEFIETSSKNQTLLKVDVNVVNSEF
jgi:hypothetical protein